jgi:uncharacterized membrane protein
MCDKIMINRIIVIYLLALVIFLIIDLLWLGFIARDFYRSRMAHLMLEKPNWGVAFVFYTLYVAGLVYFAIYPALQQQALSLALLNGALFGFFAYLTYEATNMAVLKGWSYELVIVDTVWGTLLSGLTAWLVTFLYMYWTK